MAGGSTASRRSSASSSDGFTLTETLVALAVGAVVLGAAFGVGMGTRDTVFADQSRGANEQNLRSTLEYVGLELRDAGHLMSKPAASVEVIDGRTGSRDTDTLILRRSLVDAPAKLCGNITAGWERYVTLGVRGDPQDLPLDCVTTGDNDGSGYDDLIDLWRNYRLTNGVPRGGDARTLQILIYEPSTGNSDTLTYFDEEKAAPTDRWVGITTRAGARFQYYPRFNNPITVSVVEERRFFLQNGDLVMTLNGGPAQTVAAGVESFDAAALLTDGTVMNGFRMTSRNSGALEGVRITVRATAKLKGRSSTGVMSNTFTPRTPNE
ncbi:PilW family protein [Deinococcus pimensis]|uniref:PilW family protein n=1 Tax=Deinococcus pimensis TaxID=309888 RepID=UPI0004BB27CA|nr:prepilin-type N-terminal cleavage/methylation domain-containing protein [Deinococcus pimensis]